MSTPPSDPEEIFDPEEILDCARSIRPALSDLLGASAESFDRQLAQLIAQANANQPVESEILRLLRSDPTTAQWTAAFLNSTTTYRRFIRGFSPLPGSIGSVSAQKYVCPRGDYVWYRRSIGIPIPACPSHPELGALVLEE